MFFAPGTGTSGGGYQTGELLKMAVEIERRFLVSGEAWRQGTPTCFRQGYLNHDKDRTVRVRVAGEQCTLTIKGLTIGASRMEFEYSIPFDDSIGLLALCEGAIVEKNRYLVPFDGLVWEVDEFLGMNNGLIIAEVELESESQTLTMPDWVGTEITSDFRYSNSNLAKHPFATWL